MKTIKVSEATEPQLDWLVAKCMAQVHKDRILNGTTMYGWWIYGLFVDSNYWIRLNEFKPSSNWSQGGPIIEREHISTEWSSLWDCWTARDLRNAALSFMGPTPLIAAMRSFVARRLGKEVKVPDELA